MRFNHMELTLPRGTLTPEFRAEINAFYGDIFGWDFLEVPIVKQLGHLCRMDEHDFILLLESDTPITSVGYDHLGVLMDTREEVDEVLRKCQAWQEKDDRVRLKLYEDLHTGNSIVHAFYVRHLLPIWLDVQVIEKVGP